MSVRTLDAHSEEKASIPYKHSSLLQWSVLVQYLLLTTEVVYTYLWWKRNLYREPTYLLIGGLFECRLRECISLKKWANPGLFFCLFSSFGIWTWGGRMEGTNESTELQRHPTMKPFSRRRWATGLAQQSNMYGKLPCMCSILNFGFAQTQQLTTWADTAFISFY